MYPWQIIKSLEAAVAKREEDREILSQVQEIYDEAQLELSEELGDSWREPENPISLATSKVE